MSVRRPCGIRTDIEWSVRRPSRLFGVSVRRRTDAARISNYCPCGGRTIVRAANLTVRAANFSVRAATAQTLLLLLSDLQIVRAASCYVVIVIRLAD